MKPCREVHGDFHPGCKVCVKARTERWAMAWGEPYPPPPLPDGIEDQPTPPPAPPVPPPELCSFRGDDLTPQQKQVLRLPMWKSWGVCGHPERPLGEFVCPCEGCGPTCTGYRVEA